MLKIRTKSGFENHTLILKRYLSHDQMCLIEPALEFTRYLMERCKKLQSELTTIQNTKLIQQNEQTLDQQAAARQLRKDEKYRAIVLSLRAQGLEGTPNWKLIIRSMGFTEQQAREMK